MLAIDHRSPVPLHSQVECLLRELILQRRYQKGGLLPDEVTLAAKLGVSRGTVRLGISKSVYQGVLERKAGIGTRVSQRLFESGIRAWRSFTQEMASKGIQVKDFRLDYRLVPATSSAAEALQLEPGSSLWRLDRVCGWNGKPVPQTTSWFHPRLGLRGSEDFSQPLYQTIESASGVRPHHAREDFLAINADARIARLLRVTKGAPLLARRHTVFDPGNRPFEYAEVRYASSRFALTLEIKREDG